MKKVLVLSCSTGEGHNSAAYAVLEELESRGIEGIYQKNARHVWRSL